MNYKNIFTRLIDANENVQCPHCFGEGYVFGRRLDVDHWETKECPVCYGNITMTHWEAMQGDSEYYSDYAEFIECELEWNEDGTFFEVPFTGKILIDLGLER